MKLPWLARVRSWLPGVQEVSATCPEPVLTPVLEVWQPPAPRQVSALDQAAAIISELQDEGLTGVIPRGRILRRYPEHCWALGFEPVPLNVFCEALGRLCDKPRIMLNGRKVTAYRIPTPTETPWPPLAPNVLAYPLGNKSPVLPANRPESTRTGTSPHA